MAFNGHKTIMLQKQYLYVKASKGFQLVGSSTERIWTNTGYYRFLVENVAKSIGNSYVTIDYDNTDTEFLAYCSDLFLEEVQNSVVAAVENINDSLDDFAEQNHDDIGNLASGLATLMSGLASETSLSSVKSFVESLKDIIAGNNSGAQFLMSQNLYDIKQYFDYFRKLFKFKGLPYDLNTEMVMGSSMYLANGNFKCGVMPPGSSVSLMFASNSGYLLVFDDFGQCEVISVTGSITYTFNVAGRYSLYYIK